MLWCHRRQMALLFRSREGVGATAAGGTGLLLVFWRAWEYRAG